MNTHTSGDPTLGPRPRFHSAALPEGLRCGRRCRVLGTGEPCPHAGALSSARPRVTVTAHLGLREARVRGTEGDRDGARSWTVAEENTACPAPCFWPAAGGGVGGDSKREGPPHSLET